jgi:hypothetical protein
LVATGKSFSKSIEVVNLDASKPNLVCDNLPGFPVGLEGGTGQLFQGTTPIICGGARPNRFVDSCDCYALKNGVWNKISGLQECRRFSSSTLVSIENDEEVLMMAGGRLEPNNLKSIESFDGTDWDQERFSFMPKPVWEHWLVKINSSTLLSIGGMEGDLVSSAVPNTYFYNAQDNQWTEGPALHFARTGLTCGVLNWNNPETNQMEKVVVAAGGFNTFSLAEVELLFLDGNKNTSSWISGPYLPRAAWLSTMIEFQNSVILIGGELGVDGRHLYQLTSPSGTWVEMKQTLKEPRAGHVSFLVPDELVNCH